MSSKKDNTIKHAHYEFIIVGAGLAGLQAGEVLAQNNKDFLILEASNSTGGRVRTDYLEKEIQDQKITYEWLKVHGDGFRKLLEQVEI